MQKQNFIYQYIYSFCEYNSLEIPIFEYKFCINRKWRFDVAFVKSKVAVEIEGGVWQYGRHNRAIGFLKDLEKYNKAVELGWRVLRYTPQDIDFKQIKNILKKE